MTADRDGMSFSHCRTWRHFSPVLSGEIYAPRHRVCLRIQYPGGQPAGFPEKEKGEAEPLALVVDAEGYHAELLVPTRERWSKKAPYRASHRRDVG